MTEGVPEKEGCLAFLFRPFRRPAPLPPFEYTPVEEDLPYRLRDDFLSPSELSYFSVLRALVGSRVTICPKVRIADLLFVARPHENRAYFNRIAQRHVDFVLCEASTMQPLLAIELDDSSHDRPEREDADEFLNSAFEAAALPVVRVPAKHSYSRDEVLSGMRHIVAEVYRPRATAPKPPTPEAAPQTDPVCPRCGIPMVLRTASKGRAKGTKFYGCANYPKCTQVIPLDAARSAG